MANVATMTSTRIDSGCKHIIPCKVAREHMLRWCNNDADRIYKNKMKYSVHKDELVLGVNRAMISTANSNSLYTSKQAYPAIVSNLGDMPSEVTASLAALYNLNEVTNDTMADVSPQAMAQANAAAAGGNAQAAVNVDQNIISMYNEIPCFTFMGYSLGLAYADPRNGDTVVSCMVGGKKNWICNVIVSLCSCLCNRK